MLSARYSCHILLTLEFSGQIFRKKYSDIKFYENPSSGSELFHADGRTDGRIDRHDGANSRFLQLYKRA
jgi:hypothetical protein